MKYNRETRVWLEYLWPRPDNIGAVWEMLSHLAALTPLGPVVFEARGRGGHIRCLNGADRMYIVKTRETAYGKPAAEVEAEFIDTLAAEPPQNPDPEDTPVGRRKKP